MHSILTYLLLCPLVGIAGFVDAIAGGGGLISLPAYLIAGIPVHNALGTNKLSSTMGTTVATVRYARSGFIPWQQALLCVLFALAGSSLGAKLALTIPTSTVAGNGITASSFLSPLVAKGNSPGAAFSFSSW